MYSYTNNPSAPPSGLDPSGFKTDPNSGLGPLTSWADQVRPLTPMFSVYFFVNNHLFAWRAIQ